MGRTRKLDVANRDAPGYVAGQNRSMLIRPHDDASDDIERWRSFVTQQAFGHLVASGLRRSVPVVVPTQFALIDDTLTLHLARPNPIFECLSENARCLMSVAGDWAYIPASWKAIQDEDPRSGIPTTYYGAVQLTGTATILDDPAQVADVLRLQLDDLEPAGDYIDPEEHGKKLGAIRGVQIAIEKVRAKLKYGGNVDQAHRDRVAEHLRARSGPGDNAAIDHMLNAGPSAP